MIKPKHYVRVWFQPYTYTLGGRVRLALLEGWEACIIIRLGGRVRLTLLRKDIIRRLGGLHY